MTVKRSMSVHPIQIDIINKEAFPVPHFRSGDPRWILDKDHNVHRWDGPWGYLITRVTNSLDYRPGNLLTREQTHELIESGWTVSVH